MQVYRGTAQIPGSGTSVTVNLATPVPVGQSYPIVTASINQYGSPVTVMVDPALGGVVDGNYTTITFSRRFATTPVTNIAYEIVTGLEFTVQMVTATIETTSATAAITAVDLTKSFIVSYSRVADPAYDGNALNDDDVRVRAVFNNSTQVGVYRYSSSTTYMLTRLYVVEMDGATVQPISGTIASGAASGTVTVTSVDTTKSFMLFTWLSTLNSRTTRNSVRGAVTNSTTLTFTRGQTSGTITISGFLITHDKVLVQHGAISLPVGTLSATYATTADITVSMVLITTAHSQTYDATVWEGIYATAALSAGWLTVTRESTAIDYLGEYQIVEWVAAPPPTGLSPDDVAIMPGEDNAFTFSSDDAIVALEMQWKEVGGAYTTTSKIVTSTRSYTYPTNTFTLGKTYEWQARYWLAGEVDPSDWSAVATFDTSNPVIQNPTPYPDSSVRVDIRDFGGRLKSPYGRDIQLTIEIADNAAYTSATTYTLPAVPSGAEAIMQHAIQQGGTWYVRMTATDSDALQTVLEYSFFAGLFIQFITHPDIDIEAQSATHVTVRVKDTATEYTAVIDPAPTADKVIERLFYISTGTQANCQAVAEAFLAKLGRRQLTVSGVIPLTVTLKIGQYVRVVIPTAKINQDMILQRKQHRINEGEAVTHVTLGDIKVSDQEMIARIVERLESQGV